MKFSVITCTLNSAHYLDENINSVKNQDFINWEHIFIDGFSTDDTLSIIKKYQTEFPDRVKIFQFKPEGISLAMNQGIKKSTGKYLIHLHSDDQFYDRMVLRKVDKFLKDNNYPDWIFGKELHITDQQELGVYPKFKIYTLDSFSIFGKYFLGIHNYIRHQTVFIRLEIFRKYGFFREDLKCVMDVEMWLRIKNETCWLFFDCLISRYRHHDGAQSTNPANKKSNSFEHISVHRQYLNILNFFIFYILNYLLELRIKLKK